MYLLPKWVLANKFPAIHDFESLTVIDQTARIYGAMNQLIEEYNAFADQINKSVEEFQTASEEDRKKFEIAMRQEFQDFIDAVDLKIRMMDQTINDIEGNIEQITKDTVNKAINSGRLYVEESYDPETESLNMAITGGV